MTHNLDWRSDPRYRRGYGDPRPTRQIRDDPAAVPAGEQPEPQAPGFEEPGGCRYRNHPMHVCSRRGGGVLRPGELCWLEARARLEDQGELPSVADWLVD